MSGTPVAGEDAWPGQGRHLRPGSSAASPLRDERRGKLAVGSPGSHGGCSRGDVKTFVSLFYFWM